MEITTTTMSMKLINNCPKLLRFHSPLLQSHASVRNSLHFSVISHSTVRNPRFVTCCLSNENTSNTVAEVAVKDPSLAVKKKAADILPELKGTSIFLVGMASSIKTSLGKLLADSLRYYYFDSDSLVLEAAGGESAAKAFRESDERGYREAETEVLKQLSSMGRLVVCAGNGAVQSSTNLALLRHGVSIWIDVPLDMVTRGVVEDQSEDTASEVAALYQQMKGGYSTADATISLQKVANQLGYDDLDAVTTEDMTMEVLKEIEKLTRVKKMLAEAAKPF
ncbi:probable inactive shikimate kinase like 1, chloroplastic [Pistacia vera]|uniref:probable inactive shikimate kinase like 1, chloroplastic n=1 Tax=Pistacia vera TaxID=55513 RepID=UPI00126361A5|nr:probable inactive shikimate kinase like 1, chloroplastic [Pistacia vera]